MFARTSRLTLRPGWPEDAAALTAAIAHRAVVANLARVPWPYAVADAEAFLARSDAHGELFCLIFAHEAAIPRLIGGIGLAPDGDAHEFGYWLTPSAWGRGYATEAGQAMLDNARHSLRLTRFTAGHFVDNPASGRVLAKLGFRVTGAAVPRFCRAEGRSRACVPMALDLAEPACADPMALCAA